jgi:transposase
LTAAAIECYVLAPTRIAHSAQHQRRKTDLKDAHRLLDLLRSHVLAGCELPAVWIPDAQTRDDRELVRARLDVSQKISGLKTQIKCLLKRSKQVPPDTLNGRWTRIYRAWLLGLRGVHSDLPEGTKAALASLLRQLEALEKEAQQLDQSLVRLVDSPRYLTALQEMVGLKGVGALTGLVFLTELGDLNRFQNRRQVGAFLGLVPSSHESGDRSDCKGHITRQGPSRVRKVLCQATWSRVRTDEQERAVYQRIAAKNPKHKKIAVVASMRRLAIRLWHRGREGLERGQRLAQAAEARKAAAGSPRDSTSTPAARRGSADELGGT